MASPDTASATRWDGWLLRAAAGLGSPNAEDVYAHIGIKSGGVALDGEGKYGPNVPDPRKPWAEKSITLDLFGYHGLQRLDNGTGATAGGTPSPQQQDDQFNAAGVVLHGQLDSLVMMAGAQIERHDRPSQGTRRDDDTRRRPSSMASPTWLTRPPTCSTTRSTTSCGPGSCREYASSTRTRPCLAAPTPS